MGILVTPGTNCLPAGFLNPSWKHPVVAVALHRPEVQPDPHLLRAACRNVPQTINARPLKLHSWILHLEETEVWM